MWSSFSGVLRQAPGGTIRRQVPDSKPLIHAIFPVLLLLAAMLWPGQSQASFWQATITRGDWQQVAGGRLVEFEPVRELLSLFEETSGVVVTVRYPGGDVGSAWARTFRDKMVALGIPSSYIEMIPGSGGLDILHVSLVDGK
ncbi:MAG: hypothetical protein DHS20C01_06850 [marine bacterium B5-7]|nr:MAG: hypothetical protein DHS20C01_06850 [marine bacterium B5-7]